LHVIEMNKEVEETIESIFSILRQESEELSKEFPNIKPSLILTSYNESEIEELEKEFNIKVPRIQKEFIAKYSPERFHIMYTDIYGIAGLRKELQDYIPEELLKEGYLPFAGSEGNYYCLNMEKDEDRVYFFDHEEYGISRTGLKFGSFFKDLLASKLEMKEDDNM
ncbi:SMI1/KNR4 family protein, partial [Pontibacter beigongshangensis]|uniref:SMI1/KNR4 family protein n=1 Tax=Pontibacter beigongshangensis TaxID=2574733 RepID=UPI0019D614BC